MPQIFSAKDIEVPVSCNNETLYVLDAPPPPHLFYQKVSLDEHLYHKETLLLAN